MNFVRLQEALRPNQLSDTTIFMKDRSEEFDAADDRRLLEHVEAHGGNCPACAYNLEGLSNRTCPECGSRLLLRLGADGGAHAPWLLAIVFFAMGAGFDLIMSVCIPILWRFLPPRAGTEAFWQGAIVLFGALGLACLTGCLAVARKRRTWARYSATRAWRLAIGIGIGLALVHACVGLMILPYI